jgi:hypothetical protein
LKGKTIDPDLKLPEYGDNQKTRLIVMVLLILGVPEVKIDFSLSDKINQSDYIGFG